MLERIYDENLSMANYVDYILGMNFQFSTTLNLLFSSVKHKFVDRVIVISDIRNSKIYMNEQTQKGISAVNQIRNSDRIKRTHSFVKIKVYFTIFSGSF